MINKQFFFEEFVRDGFNFRFGLDFLLFPLLDKRNMIYGVLILQALLLALLCTVSTSSTFSICYNTHFLKAGRFSVDTSQSYNNASATAWNPLIFVVVYADAFPNAVNTSVVIATDSMYIQHSGGRIQFSGKLANNTGTQLVFSIESNLASSIKTLGYRYVIITNEYSSASSNLAVQSYFFNINLNISTSKSAVGSITYPSALLTPSSSIVFVPFISGVDLETTSSNNVIDIALSVSGNATKVAFSIISSSTTPTFVRSLNTNLMIYNSDYYTKVNFASFSLGQLEGTAGPSSSPLVFSNTSNLYQPNLMAGISSLKFNQSTFTQFAIGINSPNQIFLSSDIPNNFIKMGYISMQTYFCNSTTTYSPTTNQCISQCPVRTVLDSSNTMCAFCTFDCYTCNSAGQCLSCNLSTDHRELNNNSRCVPITGYYEVYAVVAEKCPIGCSECSSNALCSICEEGFTLSGVCVCPSRTYLDLTTCKTCPYDCYTCNTQGQCLSCSSSDFRVLSNNRCIPQPGYYDSNTTQAQKCPLGCSLCTSSNVCSACEQGFMMSNNLCICPPRTFLSLSNCSACPFSCYTCSSSGGCLTCNSSDDHRRLSGTSCVPEVGYYQSNITVAAKCHIGCYECSSDSFCTACLEHYLLVNSSCSYFCPPRYYVDSLNCTACPYDCYTCSNLGDCLSCNTSQDNREKSNNRCKPLLGYFQTNISKADRCPVGCTQCTSLSVCSACEQAFTMNGTLCTLICPPRTFLNSSSCDLCPYDCYTCTSQNTCLSCSSSDHRYFLNGRCAVQEGYYESYKATAEKCPLGCILCSSLDSCTSCLQTFTLSYGSCVCPARTYLAGLSCVSCSFNCYTCDGFGNCLSCNSLHDHRVLDLNRCIPEEGYFESHLVAAERCPQGCSLCQSRQICHSCSSFYVLSNQTCLYTQIIGQGGSNSGLIAGIVIGILLAVGIPVGYYIYRKYHGGQEEQNKRRSEIYEAHSMQTLIDGWNQQKEISLEKECPIALVQLYKVPFLFTICNHQYSVGAIGNWIQSQRKKQLPITCSLCTKDLSNEQFKVFCPCKCKDKDLVGLLQQPVTCHRFKWVAADQILEHYQHNSIVRAFTHPKCQKKQEQ